MADPVGGASGVGAGCADALVAAGRRVVVADLKAIDAQASRYGGSVAMDMREPDDVRAAVAAVMAEHGPNGALVNTVGTAHITALMEISAREWDLILSVNLRGAFHLLQGAQKRWSTAARLS